MARPLSELLGAIEACDEAAEWGDGRSISKRSYDACHRGDWLLWLAFGLGVDASPRIAAACECARLALGCIPAGELRPPRAIEAAENRDAEDDSSEIIVVASDNAAAARRRIEYRAAAYYAARAAEAAVDMIRFESSGLAAAENAASALGPAAGDGGDGAAWLLAHKQCAAIVRKHIPYKVMLAAADA